MVEPDLPKLLVPKKLYGKMVVIARQYRKEPTASEALLWQALRGKKLDGIKFRRQQPIGPWFEGANRLLVHLMADYS